MRRAALLKAKALVHSLSLAVCAPATLLNAPLIEFVPVPPVDHVSYTHLRVWAHTLGQLCGIYISSRAWPIGSLSSPQIPSRLATHRVYCHILVMQRLVQGIGSTRTTMHWMIPCCLILKVTSRKTFFMLKCFVRVGRYSRFLPVSHTFVSFLALLPYQTSLSQTLADSEDLTGTQLKQKAKSLVLQVAAVVLMHIGLFHRN
jgi:hypothetical protein